MRWTAIIAGLLVLTLAGCKDETSAAKAEGRSKLSLRLLDFTYEVKDGLNQYHHRRVFTESGGVGTTIVRGRVCVQHGSHCVDALVHYRIDAMQTLEQKGHYVATPEDKDRITLHYWAEDDAGNKYELEKVLLTDGKNVTVE